MAQFKGAVGRTNQAGDLQAEMRHDFADLAVFAFSERDDKPHIGAAVRALHPRVQGPVSLAVNRDALSEPSEARVKTMLRNRIREWPNMPEPRGATVALAPCFSSENNMLCVWR